jgi:succinyl-CoA synthetase beta subunit
MYIYEYKAKSLFQEYGIPIPRSGAAKTPETAAKFCRELGRPVMVKAQVGAGGRGKAGLVLPANTAEEVREAAASILGRTYHDETVKLVLIEEQLSIARELYAAVTMDFAAAKPVFLVSGQGGVEIEQLAATSPDQLISLPLEPNQELFSHRLRDLWRRCGFQGSIVARLESVSHRLAQLFFATDALTAEINPLVITKSGEVAAADAKLIIDDEAVFRQGTIGQEGIRKDYFTIAAADLNVTYVNIIEGGDIGIICGGAGLSMATMDAFIAAGGKPAAFIDLGGGISRERMKGSVSLMAETPGLKGIFINVFGGVNNCLTMASGLADYLAEAGGDLKYVVKMRGFEQEEGWRILREYGIPTIKHETTGAAIRLMLDVLREV